MQAANYSPELIATFNGYAASAGPCTKPEYRVLHTSVQVPRGYLPIRIIQFHRGQRPTGGNRLNHWAIYVPTSTRRGVGNFYEIGGSLQTGYVTQHVVHDRHGQWEQERGGHLVGYVAPGHLGTLEAHLSLVPVKQGRADWNCQSWVVEALRGLTQPHLYAVQMDHGQWAQQMQIVEDAWNVGDA